MLPFKCGLMVGRARPTMSDPTLPSSSPSRELFLAGLWRYPVKTLAGEPLDSAELTATGIPGDRIVHVRGPEGVRTSRKHHHLLGLRGTLGPDGQPLVNGHPWDSPEALALVKGAAGDD